MTTAEQLFNQNSFNSVGVDLIRDKSGCSKTTMYTHFQNKQQLVIEVLKQRDLVFRENLTHAVGNSTGLDAIEKIYDWHVSWFQMDQFKGCLFVRAVAEASSHQDIEIINISKLHKKWVRTYIQQQILDDFYNAEDIAELIFNLLEGLISRFLVDGFDQKIADQTKKIIDLYIKSA